VAVAVVVVGVGKDFTDAGHTTALVLGTAVATRFGEPARLTPLRWSLLAAGAGFGYLMLAGGGPTLIVATALSAAGAVLAEVVIGRRRAHVRASQPVDPACALSPGVA